MVKTKGEEGLLKSRSHNNNQFHKQVDSERVLPGTQRSSLLVKKLNCIVLVNCNGTGAQGQYNCNIQK